MPKAHEQWRVLPHGPIDELAENLWRVEGSLEGMPLKRVMTIVRMSDGRLVVHSAIALEDDLMKRIEAWGTPAYLVVPNGYHRLDARAYKERYPKLDVLCPRRAKKRVEQIVPVTGTYDDLPADPAVSARHLAGVRDAEGVLLVRSRDGATLVLNDVVFNMPHVAGPSGFVLRHVTQSTGGPRITRIGRWFVVRDRAALRRDLEELAATAGLRRIVVSHHLVISEAPVDVLRAIAASLG